MYAVFFRIMRLIKAIQFEEQKRVTANRYTTKCLPEIKVIEYPPYSLDLAMCDFWLLFNSKKNFYGCIFPSEEESDANKNTFFFIYSKK